MLSGYVEIVDEGFAIHLSDTKAIIVPFNSFIDMGKKFKPLKDYHITKCSIGLDVGIKNNLLASMELSFVFNYISNILKWYFSNRKFHLKIQDKINVHEGKNILDLYIDTTLVLNVLMIIISVIKIIVEKFLYAISNRKQQNNQNY